MLDPEKDHYKPVKTVCAFNNNYIQYESIGDKDKSSQGEWKIHLTMAINFISSKDSNEPQIMHSKTDNVEIMMGIIKYQNTTMEKSL